MELEARIINAYGNGNESIHMQINKRTPQMFCMTKQEKKERRPLGRLSSDQGQLSKISIFFSFFFFFLGIKGGYPPTEQSLKKKKKFLWYKTKKDKKDDS